MRYCQTFFRNRLLGCAFMFCLAFLPVRGEPVPFRSSLDISQYAHTAWTTLDGSFRYSIFSVAQTTDGYLWLAGTSGLVRFDGVHFREWTPQGGDSLPRYPQRVWATRDGSLWVGGLGLAQLKDGVFKRFHKFDHSLITALLEDSKGTIWIGTVGNGLCSIQSNRFSCLATSNTPFLGLVQAIYEDKAGTIWAGSSRPTSGVCRIESGGPRCYPYKGGGALSMSEGPDGKLLMAMDGSLCYLDSENKIIEYPLSPSHEKVLPRSLLRDRDGGIWIGTANAGLIHLHEGAMDTFTKSNGLSSNGPITNIMQDREGTVWVVTQSGLDRFRRLAIPSITESQGLSSSLINSVLQATDGSLWIGTVGGLDHVKDNNVEVYDPKHHGLGADTINSLFEDSHKRLLVTATNTDSRMWWIEKGRVLPVSARVGEDPFSIAEDSHGTFWLLGRQQGLLNLSADGAVIAKYSSQDLKHARNFTYDVKRDGFWLGRNDGRIDFFKDGQVAEHYGPVEGLAKGLVKDLQPRGDGSVWASTENGLVRLRKGKFAVLNSHNGLPCDTVHWMMPDNEGAVWLYMECGLVRISQEELAAWDAQPDRGVKVLNHFTNMDGVENAALSGWYSPQVVKINDGRILFAQTSGLGVIDPRRISYNAQRPPVHIESAFADGKQYLSIANQVLPKRVHTVHFSFTALSLVNPQRVFFRYQLVGYDKGWSEVGSTREVDYTNLPPGHYQFRVIACNNDGLWNMEGARFDFRVPPAFTQTIWYTLAWVLCIVIAMVCLFWYRLRYLTQQMQQRMMERLLERARIARELHDTLLQGFHSVVLNFRVASDLLAINEPARPLLEEALQQSARVLTEGRERVMDLRNSSTEKLEQALSAVGEELQKTTPCAYRIVVDGKVEELHPVLRDEVYRIGREAITNAFRHACASAIDVEIFYKSTEFKLLIRDNGKGIEAGIFNEGCRPGHWGLIGMRERATKSGGQLSVCSREKSGTEIELRIPARLAYVQNQKRGVLGRLKGSVNSMRA